MEHYLVRKRPFADHPPPPPKKSRTHMSQGAKRHTPAGAGGAGAPSLAFVPASSAAARAASSSSAPWPSSSSSSSRPQGQLRQISLTQMSKVTVLDEVSSMHAFLQSAFERREWTAVVEVLQQLRDVFISKMVLEKTGIGRTLTNIKNECKLQVEQQQAESKSAPSAPTDADGSDEVDEEDRLLEADRPDSIDLTDAPASRRNGSSSSSSSARSSAQSAAAQSEASALALQLLGVWRAQVKKEMAAEAASGASGLPALDFSQYSSMKNRTRTYKEIYFLLTERDEKESPAQQVARRQACKPLLARDPPAAAVASELEQMLFRMHRARHTQQRLNSANSELLSAAPAHPHREDADAALMQEPPSYAPHARNLLQTLRTNFAKVQQLRRWVGADQQADGAAAAASSGSSSPSADLASSRRSELEQLVNSTKTFCA